MNDETVYEPTQGQLSVDPTTRQGVSSEEVPEDRQELVKEILAKIKAADRKFEKRFKRMREDMKFARKGAEPGWDADAKYTANLVQRLIKQRVSALYAKNPTVKARRRQTLDYKIWDGNVDVAKQAMQLAGSAVAGMPVAPEIQQQLATAALLLQDIMQGRQKQQLMDKLGKTLEIIFTYYMTEGQPPFKLRAKQLVRRTVTCGVGYVKLGFQRTMGRTPDWNARLADAQEQIAHLESLAADESDPDKASNGARLEELKLGMQALQNEPQVTLREGLIFDFPRSMDVFPVGDCVELKGFVGADAVVQRMYFTVDKVKEIYGVDLKAGGFTPYNRLGQVKGAEEGPEFACIFEYYDKRSGLMYTACEGYCNFLEEPHAPPAQVEQFFPFFVLSFNDVEDEDDIYPPSDVELVRHQCMEYNRSREALRQHRIANQPNYAAPAGAFPDWGDETKLMSAVPHEILKLNALAPGTKIDELIQFIKKAPIDPALYDTNFVFEDILRTVGSQEANLGGTSDATATESSIAESSRMSTQNSEIDDFDDMFSLLARAGGQILLKEISAETAQKIAGVGAVWPEMTNAQISEELYLDIEAGSSGKPNKAQELANWERMLPLLIQIPGVSPNWVAKETIKRMDDRADMAEAVLDGAPAILAMNRQQQVLDDDPESQGPAGGDNQARPPGQPGGPQPAMPAPGEATPAAV
jgi:hypothetical protein